MSTHRNVTGTARFCLGWQSYASVPLTTIDLVEASVRLPSSRPIDQRWDRSRGLIFNDRRRKIPHGHVCRPDDGIAFNISPSARRGFASRPLPGKRPMPQELDQFMVSKEDRQGTLGDRNVIAKTIAERNDALKERDVAREKEQQVKQSLARLQAAASSKLEQVEEENTRLKTRSASLDQQRTEASRERDLAKKYDQESKRVLKEAESKIALLAGQNAVLEKESAEQKSEAVRRDNERTTQHRLAMDDLHKQQEALDQAQQSLLARTDQLVEEKRRLLQKYSDDLDAFRSELRKEYEESELVTNIRSRQKVVEEAQSAQVQIEMEYFQTREQELRDQSTRTEASLTTELNAKVLHLENKMSETQNAANQALQQRRENRASQRSKYDDYHSLFGPVLKPDALGMFAGVEAEMRSRLRCLPLYPTYLTSIKNSNPWFAIKYPRLVTRLQHLGHARRSQIRADLDSARLLVQQVEVARRDFENRAHNSRDSTRYFQLTPVPNHFDRIMLFQKVSVLQPIQEEILRRSFAIRQLEYSRAPVLVRSSHMREEKDARRTLRRAYAFLINVARAKATEAMQEDDYSKKVAFRLLHEQQENFQQALFLLPQHNLPSAEYNNLKRSSNEVSDALRQFEGKVQKRAMLQQRLHPKLVLNEEEDFKKWSSKVHDQYIAKARSEIGPRPATQPAPSRIVRLPLTQRQPPVMRVNLQKHSVATTGPTMVRNNPDRTTRELSRGVLRLSDTEMVQKVEKLAVEKERMKRRPRLGKAQKQLNSVTEKLKDLESELRRRDVVIPSTNKPVTVESTSKSNLNLKPSATMQARHSLELSHAVSAHNNCFDRIDATFRNQHSSSEPNLSHSAVYDFTLLSSHAENYASHFLISDHQQDLNPAHLSAMNTSTSEQSTGDDMSIVDTDSEDVTSSFVFSGCSDTAESASPSCSRLSFQRDEVSGGKGEQAGHNTGPDVALTYEIPDQDFRNAIRASRTTDAAFWTYRLYKNAGGARPNLHYCTKLDQAEEQAQKFLDESVLGFDLEWEVGSTVNSSIKNSVSLIQIASEDRIGLFHLAMFKGDTIEELMPPTLRNILESDKVVKTGVNISGDATRMERCLNVKMRGLMELSHMFKVVMLSGQEPHKVNRGLVSLAEQVEKILLLPLKKDKVRTSAWSKRLNTTQTEYAGADAYAGFRLYHALEQRRDVMSPKPPRPAYYELQKPLVLGDGTVVRPYARKVADKKKTVEDTEEVSDAEFFDAVETMDPSEHDILDDGSNSPFTGVEAAYPTLPTGNIDLSRLRIANTRLYPTEDRIHDEAGISQDVSSEDRDQSQKPAQLPSSSVTAKAIEPATSTDNANIKSNPRKPLPDTPEMALATTWTDTWIASQRDRQPVKAGLSTLRVYHLWHMQNLDIPRVAELARDPPLMQNTVASYIMTVLTQERLPYDQQRVRDVLEYLPRTTAGRYERFLSK